MEQPELEKFKTDLHRTLISKLDLEKLSRVNSSQARQAVAEMINEIVVSQRVPLSFEQQESAIAELLRTEASLYLLPNAENARRTCAMDTGYAGDRKPWFVERFTTASLDRLPEALRAKLATGKYHSAAVGACEVRNSGSFSAYGIAVLLFP